MFPISTSVVEDVKAKTWKGAKKWNTSFSPLEVGKRWFYSEIEKIAHLEIRQGFDTYKMRQDLGLLKSKQKLSNLFEAHCVDSWVLANWYIGGHIQPDNTPANRSNPFGVSSQTAPSFAAFHWSCPLSVRRNFKCRI